MSKTTKRSLSKPSYIDFDKYAYRKKLAKKYIIKGSY